MRSDWSAVIAQLSSGDKAQLAGSARLLLAHAELMSNHNNEAAFLFMSATANDNAEWSQWTQRLEERAGDVPMAGYFRGDALARELGQPPEDGFILELREKRPDQHPCHR